MQTIGKRIQKRRTGIAVVVMVVGLCQLSAKPVSQTVLLAATDETTIALPADYAPGGQDVYATALATPVAVAIASEDAPMVAKPPIMPVVCCTDYGVCTFYAGTSCADGLQEVTCPCPSPDDN